MSTIDLAKRQLTKCVRCIGCEKLDDDSFRGDSNCLRFRTAKPDIEALKQTYNDTLTRMKKAMEFMDGPAPMEDKVKWRPEFKRIEKQLNDLKDEIRLTGHEMSDKEVLEGFGG
jgi:hypothetical protein